jgi:hypothetical protein
MANRGTYYGQCSARRTKGLLFSKGISDISEVNAWDELSGVLRQEHKRVQAHVHTLHKHFATLALTSANHVYVTNKIWFDLLHPKNVSDYSTCQDVHIRLCHSKLYPQGHISMSHKTEYDVADKVRHDNFICTHLKTCITIRTAFPFL